MAAIEAGGEKICELAAGRVASWDGLRHLTHTSVPPCLQFAERQGWLRFAVASLKYLVFVEPAVGSEVWLFSADEETVCLVEVFSLPPSVSPAGLLDELGEPDLVYRVPLAVRLQRPQQLPGPDLQEYVYAGRGLALAVQQPEGGVLELVRLRGFEAMTAAAYVEQFGELPGLRFFPDSTGVGE